MRCPEYEIRYRGTMRHDQDYSLIGVFTKYLVELDGYRLRKYGLPIMYRKGVKELEVK